MKYKSQGITHLASITVLPIDVCRGQGSCASGSGRYMFPLVTLKTARPEGPCSMRRLGRGQTILLGLYSDPPNETFYTVRLKENGLVMKKTNTPW
jgi:hypothetical protein